jgi:hypothetical protein
MGAKFILLIPLRLIWMCETVRPVRLPQMQSAIKLTTDWSERAGIDTMLNCTLRLAFLALSLFPKFFLPMLFAELQTLVVHASSNRAAAVDAAQLTVKQTHG